MFLQSQMTGFNLARHLPEGLFIAPKAARWVQ
jgi:hypothetical protein